MMAQDIGAFTNKETNSMLDVYMRQHPPKDSVCISKKEFHENIKSYLHLKPVPLEFYPTHTETKRDWLFWTKTVETRNSNLYIKGPFIFFDTSLETFYMDTISHVHQLEYAFEETKAEWPKMEVGIPISFEAFYALELEATINLIEAGGKLEPVGHLSIPTGRQSQRVVYLHEGKYYLHYKHYADFLEAGKHHYGYGRVYRG